MRTKRKKIKYDAEMPRRLYRFFASYSDAASAPSIEKFATSIGATAEDVLKFRAHSEFERALRESERIRRDYLTDRALTRKFDPSFVKFLIEREAASAEAAGVEVRIEVVE